jgi:hypothetical protein
VPFGLSSTRTQRLVVALYLRMYVEVLQLTLPAPGIFRMTAD